MTRGKRRSFGLVVALGAAAFTLYTLEAIATAAPSLVDRLGTTLRRGPSVIAETHRLRQRGIRAYPFLQSDLFTHSPDSGLTLDDATTVAPLAGIPAELTVLCNESGTTIGYRSDSFGFRNPEVAWFEPTVALVGDSFTHGFCRPESETIAGRLRARGIEVINAGMTGAGPLTELGLVREYVSRSSPSVVYWLFYEGNDLIDLSSEIRTLVIRYRDPGFTQDLVNQPQMPAALMSYGDSLVSSYRPPGAGQWLRGFLSLRNLRVATGISGAPRQKGIRDEDRELELFEEVLLAAKTEVESWNGELRLVYLPERRRFNKSAPVVGENHDFDAVHSAVVSIASNLLVPLVDISRTFAEQPDPAKMWDNRRYHYNAAGYGVVAEAIAADLGPRAIRPPATSYTEIRVGR